MVTDDNAGVWGQNCIVDIHILSMLRNLNKKQYQVYKGTDKDKELNLRGYNGKGETYKI